MKTFRVELGAWVLTALAATGATASAAENSTANSPRERVELGREIFKMNFARPSPDAGDGTIGTRGNGLGPLLNDTSCVNCHHLGGVGGAGGVESNVLMVGIVTRPRPSVPLETLLRDARQVHPGFTDDDPVKVLHRFALAEDHKVKGYETWRDSVLAQFESSDESRSVTPLRKTVGGATVELVQRNTPALFGLGAIDKLRETRGDSVRRKQAVAQEQKTPWITGRLPLTPDGKPGWFGARGQVDSLENFVRSACANEMGLQLNGFPEVELKEVGAQTGSKSKGDSGRVDLTSPEADALVAYVKSLPRPVERPIETAEAALQRRAGHEEFQQMGCADCHVPDLGPIKGLYSDMLLHDMGEEDTDVQTAVPAVRVNRTVTQVATVRPSGYGSTTSLRNIVNVSVEEIPSNPEREWKTPPLWGLRDSYPYWHDGRALTLEDAILMHGGEGERASVAYRQANPERRRQLIAFLETLEAPQTAEVPEAQ